MGLDKIGNRAARGQRGDPSLLTSEQLQSAIRVGIGPARMAWLLSCAHGGKEIGKKRGVRRG